MTNFQTGPSAKPASNLILDEEVEDEPSSSTSESRRLFMPVLIVLLALIASDVRDILTIHSQTAVIRQQNRHMAVQLDSAAKQDAFVTKLRKDLEPVSQSDPAVQSILNSLFPPPGAPPSIKPVESSTNAPTL